MTFGACIWALVNAIRVTVFYSILSRTFVLVVRDLEIWYTGSTTTSTSGGR